MLKNIKAINIILDGPPENIGGRFVEVETDDGHCINAGKWSEKEDGTWVLRIELRPTEQALKAELKTMTERHSAQVGISRGLTLENEVLKAEVERLRGAIRKTVDKYERIAFGLDGDCGTDRIINDLEDVITAEQGGGK